MAASDVAHEPDDGAGTLASCPRRRPCCQRAELARRGLEVFAWRDRGVRKSVERTKRRGQPQRSAQLQRRSSAAGVARPTSPVTPGTPESRRRGEAELVGRGDLLLF